MHPRKQPLLTELFPADLADLIQSYAMTATQEIADEVNKDITKLRNYPDVAWDEKPVKFPRGLNQWVFLSCTHFTNITFTNPDDYEHLAIDDQLFRWYNSPICKKYKLDYGSFYRVTFINAKFENMLCASFFVSQTTLIRASFKGSILTGASFKNSNLQFSDLSSCHGSSYGFYSLYISDSDLRHTNLQKSQFNSCFIVQTLLDDANLSHSSFNHSTIKHCSLERANLSNSHLSRARFDYSNLNEANFFKANLSGASFKYASMQNAKLNGAIFSLNQFSKEQVLSFHYDPHAREFIEAIYEFKEKNPTQDTKDMDELILSFIHTHTHVNGHNKTLAKFIITGMLPSQHFSPRALFSYPFEHPLRERFLEIQASHYLSLLPIISSLFSRP